MKRSTQNNLNRSAVRAHASEITCWSRTDADEEESYVVRTTNVEIRNMRRTVSESQSGWYRVRIPSGYRYDKAYFLVELRRVIYPKILTPYCWRMERRQAQFFIDDYSVAVELAAADRKIMQPNGCEMEILVDDREPYFCLNDNLKEKMADAMDTRYNAATKSMDLTKFYAHEQLRNNYCPLNRTSIMDAAIEIIASRVLDVEVLILNNNKIRYMRSTEMLGTYLPRLKSLFLANNMFTNIESLQLINQTKIVEISLTGNPIREKYNEDAVYFSEIRRRFPKLRKVDGVELPPLISFDIDAEDVQLPSPQFTFFLNQTGAILAMKFVEDYYGIYDSDDRQQLEMAYHDQALFSLTACYDISRLSAYLPFNRDLNRIHDFNTRMCQLKTGKYEIVSLLSKLPATKHDPRSFTIDLTLYTETCVLLTVTGTFCEQNDQKAFSMKKEQFVRSFHRSFVITKKSDDGVCITNDMFYVNKLTRVQESMVLESAHETSKLASRLCESMCYDAME